MKNLLIATLFAASTVTATAGSVTFVPPQATALEEPARMGGSGAWIIPLVIVGVLALALTQEDNCGRANGESADRPIKCK